MFLIHYFHEPPFVILPRGRGCTTENSPFSKKPSNRCFAISIYLSASMLGGLEASYPAVLSQRRPPGSVRVHDDAVLPARLPRPSPEVETAVMTTWTNPSPSPSLVPQPVCVPHGGDTMTDSFMEQSLACSTGGGWGVHPVRVTGAPSSWVGGSLLSLLLLLLLPACHIPPPRG